jgi:hypothetical protein
MINWKGHGRKRLWPNLKFYSGTCLEDLRKTTENLSQDSRSLGPIFESGSSRILIRSASH